MIQGTGHQLSAIKFLLQGSVLTEVKAARDSDTIILGRPVEPPDVGAFQKRLTLSGRSASDKARSGMKLAGRVWIPNAKSAPLPTNSAGFARRTIAICSTLGSFAEIGWGVAPSFQVAIQA